MNEQIELKDDANKSAHPVDVYLQQSNFFTVYYTPREC